MIKAGDLPLFLLTVGLTIFGVGMVFSASYYYALNKFGDPFYYLKRETIFAVLGLVIMMLLTRVDYRYFRLLAWPLVGVALAGLFLVFSPLGVEINNARRWIDIGGVITLMPGELAKLALIVFVAYFLSVRPHRVLEPATGLLPCLAVAGVFAGLVLKQPNMSTAMIIMGVCVAMLILAGMKWRWLILMIIVGGAGAVYAISSSEYRMERFTSFLDPFADKMDTGWQVVQSLLALGSGGITGVGIGQSVQKALYLPEPQNDFILAIIGEELGFLGIVVLMIAYLLLIWRCVHVAMCAPDTFGMLLAGGITAMLSLQVIMNFAVVTSSMPPTGVTLPFISYGGNALWLFMGCMGIMINISRHQEIPN